MPVVAVGASAGGVEALLRVVEVLPADLNAPVLVAVHLPREGSHALPAVIDRAGPLPAAYARDGEAPRPGRIYIAPPDRHLMITDHRLKVDTGARVNRSRPAIDPLFQSVAALQRPAVGVILSGALDDGAAGLEAIARAGGTAIVQDPADALYAGMPMAALELVPSAQRLPASGIGHAVAEAVSNGITRGTPRADLRADREARMTDIDRAPSDPAVLGAVPSEYGCPACGGVLWEVGDSPSGGQFRCRVGHAFSPQSLLDAQGSTVEDGLWAAARALEEQAILAGRLADRSKARADTQSHARFRRHAQAAEHQAKAVRAVLEMALAERATTESDEPAPVSDEEVA